MCTIDFYGIIHMKWQKTSMETLSVNEALSRNCAQPFLEPLVLLFWIFGTLGFSWLGIITQQYLQFAPNVHKIQIPEWFSMYNFKCGSNSNSGIAGTF